MSEFGIRLIAILGVISIILVLIMSALCVLGVYLCESRLTDKGILLLFLIVIAWVIFGCLMILECAFEWHWLLT